MSWGRAGSRRGYNPIRDDRVSRCSLPGRRWTKGENAPHEASERTEVKQVHAIRAQVFGVDLEALELALDLIRPRIAARGPLRIPSPARRWCPRAPTCTCSLRSFVSGA